MTMRRSKGSGREIDELDPDYGYVHKDPPKVGAFERVDAVPAPLRAGWLPNFTTPPYPVRSTDGLGAVPVIVAGGTMRVVRDFLALGGDVVSFQLGQVYFPVDYTYRIALGIAHEDLGLAGDVIGFQLGQVFFPVEYAYTRPGYGGEGDPPADPIQHEDLALGGDVIGFQLGQAFFPVDYLNYAPERLWLGGDVTSFTLETA